MPGFTPDDAAALGGPPWLRQRRAAAAEAFAATALPTDAEEVWRYSRIAELDLDAFAPAQQPSGATGDAVPGAMAPVLDEIGRVTALVVVRDGWILHVELDDALAARGVAVGPADSVAGGEDAVGTLAPSATDAFTLLNAAMAPMPLVVRVPAGVVVERPIVVVQWADQNGGASFPHTVVQLGADAECVVVEHQTSADVRALVDPVVELDLADAARLRYLNVQELGPSVWQTGYQASRLGRDASLRSTVVALGGDYARVRTDSQLVGKGGSSDLLALYFGGASQMHDFRTMQDHVGPQTTSNLLFKGAVQDRAQGVYSGLIRVRKGAAGTNAFQTNRNLVLSEGAHADSVPNLEIEENQVQCSHASAVGPIDEEQRFYLESRGVPPDVAERLIVLGFFAEVLDQLALPALGARLRSAVSDKLDARTDA